ncbi:hypothetical protein ACFV9C_44655 [Kribbella sp. NPDC059898]|uniref:hypothetical protein n=1 Tax=Kribbella sp. NPDC059898 TaxID=3346995 RepID=UPI003646CA10
MSPRTGGADVLDWTSTTEALADEGVVVDTRDSSDRATRLVRKGRLWFFEDNSMYMYYTPTAWRPATT